MERHSKINVNTPERYDMIFMGIRTTEVMALPDVYHLLSMIVKNGKVLDLGCGLGRYFPAFNNCDITGTELSLKAIAKIKETYPNAKVIQHDLNKGIPYENEAFDYVYAGELLEHIENPQFLVDECYRILKPKGMIFANTPYKDSILCEEHLWKFNFNDMNSLFSKFKKSVFRLNNTPDEKWEHFLVVGIKG